MLMRILKLFLPVVLFTTAIMVQGCSFQKDSQGALPAVAEVDGVKMVARTAGRHFEVYSEGCWQNARR